MASNKSPNGFTIQVPTKEKPFSGCYGTDIASPLGRIAFVNLDKPVAAQAGQTAKYGVTLLVDKNDPENAPFIQAIKEMGMKMAIDLWGDKAKEKLSQTKRKIFGDGDVPSSTGKTYEGYPGNWVMNLRNAKPEGHNQGWRILNPGLVADNFEAGMICRCTVQPYLNADGFSYSLRNIKKIKDDGVRFGGAPDAAGVIDHLDEAEAAVSAAPGTNFDL